MNDNHSDLKHTVKTVLSNPIIMFGMIFLVSSLSLMTALIAEYIYSLEPCVLCIYQRWPYVITCLLGIAGMATLYKEEWSRFSAHIVFVSALIFLTGSIIAFYHVGVEQHWWSSFLEGCHVDFDAADFDTKDLMALFDNKPAVRCDEIPWADPVFGISMAGYNFIMSLGLAIILTFSAIFIERRRNGVL